MRFRLLSLALFALPLSLSAQVEFGLKTGLNFSSVWLANDEYGDPLRGKFSYNFGGFLSAPISDKWDLYTGLEYSRKGEKGTRNEVDIVRKINYIDIPVMLAYRPSENVGLFFGPQIGFLVAGNFEVDGEENDVTDQLNQTDVSVVAGVFIPVSEKVWFDIRYQAGFSNFIAEGDARASNNMFQISLLAPLTPYLSTQKSVKTISE